jgi:hypothetical protein
MVICAKLQCHFCPGFLGFRNDHLRCPGTFQDGTGCQPNWTAAQNDPKPEPGGDEVDEAFATPGMTESYMALTSYSNMADVIEGNLVFEPCWGIKPVLGVQSQSYLGIINQAPHPNAAKLWIAWQVSEEGREPWAKFGTYFTDSAYEVPEGMKPLDEMMGMTWFIDEQFAYDNMLTARDFYLLNLGN